MRLVPPLVVDAGRSERSDCVGAFAIGEAPGMNWLALAVLSSFAALLAGAVGWSAPATRGRTLARRVFICLVLLAVMFFAVTANETTAFWPTQSSPAAW